jgi:hypothetical protein
MKVLGFKGLLPPESQCHHPSPFGHVKSIANTYRTIEFRCGLKSAKAHTITNLEPH